VRRFILTVTEPEMKVRGILEGLGLQIATLEQAREIYYFN
jgi:hypothetical protein